MQGPPGRGLAGLAHLCDVQPGRHRVLLPPGGGCSHPALHRPPGRGERCQVGALRCARIPAWTLKPRCSPGGCPPLSKQPHAAVQHVHGGCAHVQSMRHAARRQVVGQLQRRLHSQAVERRLVPMHPRPDAAHAGGVHPQVAPPGAGTPPAGHSLLRQLCAVSTWEACHLACYQLGVPTANVAPAAAWLCWLSCPRRMPPMSDAPDNKTRFYVAVLKSSCSGVGAGCGTASQAPAWHACGSTPSRCTAWPSALTVP